MWCKRWEIVPGSNPTTSSVSTGTDRTDTRGGRRCSGVYKGRIVTWSDSGRLLPPIHIETSSCVDDDNPSKSHSASPVDSDNK